ncbi:dipeptide ABC transporter ATP-binding protein [Leucobacter chromiireducens]|uniref:ABC transporter ATP-binding protein n=1 Tax=Leucobacter chromiireducens subsp. solipictus TaxID=398235 RepID=A0ABS1SHK1_9MICO|nr:ABC transporter ATP-binding protein [Leucobacter chromiireducens]MBL3680052.1 ABC transporter ATP-binding protein [Leucobacter chromiireducens subsp. solipictus]
MTLLNITNLTLDLPNGTRLLDGISLRVEAGETVGLVGESGSGKSLTARSVLGLLPGGASMGGSVVCEGHDVLTAGRAELLRVRRSSAAMIFQDPRAGINPMRTIGDHMTESLRLCQGVPAPQARAAATELLRAVRLPRPVDHLSQYPHEFSGGMLQRVMIAGALTSAPKLLICDEPTTALDVTTQAEIVEVLREQRAARGMGMLFITHDLNLAASICDRVVVMAGGRVVEQGSAREIFTTPGADYTKRLIAATPSVTVSDPAPAHPAPADSAASAASAASAEPAEPLVLVRELSKTYHPRGREAVHAVRGASLAIPRGGSLGVVGESGSGKSTLARMIIGLEQPDAGELRIAGVTRTDVPRGKAERLARARSAQMVFQDPYLSLDPRIPVGQTVEDALRLHARLTGAACAERALQLLDDVGLSRDHAQALPRTLSGGQRQRVAIARAIAIEPELLVMDEATSALDVSVQAQVLDLLARVRAEQGLTILFISHDLGVVRRVCDDTLVMRRGEIVESGPTEGLLSDPQHEYTRMLLDLVPRPAWA